MIAQAARAFRVAPGFPGKARLGLRVQELLVGFAPEGLVLTVRMKDGSVLRLDPGSRTERRAIWTGTYDSQLLSRLHRLLEPGAIAVDVGANVGFYSVALGRLLQPLGGRVLAVEPLPANHTRLRENVELNGLADSVTTVPVALGDRPGIAELRLEAGAPTGNAVAVTAASAAAPAGTVVPVETLDALAERIGLASCHLIKLDVEGSELAVVRGARRLLADHRPVVLAELNRYWMAQRGWSLADLIAETACHGYRCYRQHRRGFVPLDGSTPSRTEDVVFIPAGTRLGRRAAAALLEHPEDAR